MISQFAHLKKEATALRKTGKTYSEIIKKLKAPIPKSTLSLWCKNIIFSSKNKERIAKIIKENLARGRFIVLASNKIKRRHYLQEVYSRVSHLGKLIKNKNIAKISLAVLYLGEGSKNRSSLTFGNSDPAIISLFLRLLRYCYKIDEGKFRCTLQCRADLDIQKLEKFWSDITNIPLSKFYKARVDPRTIGKISKNPEYKGVCRIDYFSADIFNELTKVIESINQTGL
jgi:hypothetical protein